MTQHSAWSGDTPRILRALPGFIDHTLLKPDATEAHVRVLCEEAIVHQFASVCVNSRYVPLCREFLDHSSVAVCTVVGFPLGANASDAKSYETEWAVNQGATEVDMVIPVGSIKSGHYLNAAKDVQAVTQAARPHALVKVIIETCLLTHEEKVNACLIARAAGAHFVKTSTGFSTQGATVEDVRLMRQIVGATMGVKASGGVRDFETAMHMIYSGASRIGASAGVSIVSG
ncbi:MAG: deoxyribose-phosphate aldolase [Candidatus Cloacimonetes bacterium 4572_55]|nr:MAG: deoxyribose-phosphate aldolase [Candidatus Cloacimonetes bacterium 4572_55]